ncbi:hypothetical protein NM208_g11120 [Fusarium decemcellulare]|uniref:Uncharacterized protein n=1 Tax=Fusarium decemcellulare TaxID=57161 RepID=A0ACC1RVF3_9HYPO|nr:hypothetical protein NM208_g11120 [Fusarium decemcellulare]
MRAENALLEDNVKLQRAMHSVQRGWDWGRVQRNLEAQSCCILNLDQFTPVILFTKATQTAFSDLVIADLAVLDTNTDIKDELQRFSERPTLHIFFDAVEGPHSHNNISPTDGSRSSSDY